MMEKIAHMADESKDARLIRLALILLSTYNLLFFWGKFLPDFGSDVIIPIYLGIQESVGFLTILEILGVASVFVDMIGRYDKLQAQGAAKLRLRIVLIAALGMAFFLKIFMNYLDSALA